jgi:hypothetical protein
MSFENASCSLKLPGQVSLLQIQEVMKILDNISQNKIKSWSFNQATCHVPLSSLYFENIPCSSIKLKYLIGTEKQRNQMISENNSHHILLLEKINIIKLHAPPFYL